MLVFTLQIAGAAALLVAVRELTRSGIVEEASAIADVLRDDLIASYTDGGLGELAELVATRADDAASSGAVILFAAPDGRVIQGNLGAWPPTVRTPSQNVRLKLYRKGRDAPEEMQVSSVRLGGGYRLLTGHVIENQVRVAGIMERASVTALAIAVALAALAAWVTARLVEARLRRTIDVARAVEAGELNARAPVEGAADAFDDLADAINAMLDRIDTLVTELKIATDGLAHDLKSPLTRMRSALERAMVAVHEQEGRAAVGRAIEEGDRLLATVETALRISRAEAGIGAENFVPTDLSAMLNDLVELYGPAAEEQGFGIVASAPDEIMFPVHRELLNQALANLVDNSLKYGAGEITLAARPEDDAIILSVSDQGSGIPADRRDEALRRFGRLDDARSGPGAGLGLSLVVAVARLHGGAVQLSDNHPGLLVEIILPLRSQTANASYRS